MAVQGKVVIITGASSGIGAATAKLLAGKGVKVVLAARRLDRLNQIKEELSDDDVSTVKADVTDYEELQSVIDFTMDKFGRIDVMFNNAGVMPVNSLASGQRQEWQHAFDVNVMGVLNGISAVLPVMKKQKAGQIITTGSVNSRRVVPGWTVYSATKYAVRAIMEGLRSEETKNNIKATLICPGSVHTELYNSIADPKAREAEIKTEKAIGLDPKRIALAVMHAIDTPAEEDINEIIIRPVGAPV